MEGPLTNWKKNSSRSEFQLAQCKTSDVCGWLYILGKVESRGNVSIIKVLTGLGQTFFQSTNTNLHVTIWHRLPLGIDR